ncbi:MAG: hypothetical protein FNT29_06075 [Halothiobacillaceae bacterium]|nr:MAG: hypothetical protein FNT29_06075 [Halothiobacillaceae bacterium]
MKAAKLETSDRLKRVHDLLKRGGEYSTMQIVQQAQVCAVNSIAAELRVNGVPVKSRLEVVPNPCGAPGGVRLWYYSLETNHAST